MQITINGETRQFDQALTIKELVERLELDMRKVAIERNMCIVPRSTYHEVDVTDGDAIEIVEFIGGG